MKLILHCGEGKTGTTSIQATLYASSKKLIKQGILYHSKHKGGHYDFSYLIGKRHRVAQEQDKVIVDRVNKTVSEIGRLATVLSPEFLILSSEGFFSYTEDEITKTIDALGIAFEEIYCIVYVRCPPDYYLSVVQQKIKGSYEIINPLVFRRNIVSPLAEWQNFVGKENFFGDVFHKEILFQGDVVLDFKRKLESITKREIEFGKYASLNESLTAEQMILMQDFRLDFLSGYNGMLLPLSSKLINFFSALNSIKQLGTKAKLRSEIKAIILANNREYILGVDDLLKVKYFSELSGMTKCFYSSSYSQSPPDKVKDILLSYDRENLNLLRNLIIEYDQDLKSALTELLGLFNDSEKQRTTVAKIYFDYLISNNYFSGEKLQKIRKLDIKSYEDALLDLI